MQPWIIPLPFRAERQTLAFLCRFKWTMVFLTALLVSKFVTFGEKQAGLWHEEPVSCPWFMQFNLWNLVTKPTILNLYIKIYQPFATFPSISFVFIHIDIAESPETIAIYVRKMRMTARNLAKIQVFISMQVPVECCVGSEKSALTP